MDTTRRRIGAVVVGRFRKRAGPTSPPVASGGGLTPGASGIRTRLTSTCHGRDIGCGPSQGRGRTLRVLRRTGRNPRWHVRSRSPVRCRNHPAARRGPAVSGARGPAVPFDPTLASWHSLPLGGGNPGLAPSHDRARNQAGVVVWLRIERKPRPEGLQAAVRFIPTRLRASLTERSASGDTDDRVSR